MEMFSEKLEPHLQRLVEAGVSGLDIMHGHLKILMLEADAQLAEAQRIEDETEEAMDSMERKYWEGVGDAYTSLYKLTYDLSFAIAGMEKNDD
jgi:hypothetical protein